MRYEICYYCRRRWNVSAGLTLPLLLYICPKCEYKLRAGTARKKRA